MPKINPRIKSIDDLLGLDAAEERPIEPTPSVPGWALATQWISNRRLQRIRSSPPLF